jgi:glycosyltransferase involved in cell wall biosynthesis
MTKLISELSVFFPAYNEEVSLKTTVEKAAKVLDKIAVAWEIIIINDGSSDKTLSVAQKLSQSNPKVKVINHSVNQGYGASLKSGLYNAKYNWIAFTDSDGQFDFAEITKFIEKQRLTRSDLVIGYYLDRKVSGWVKFTSRVWELTVSILFGLKVRDIDCGFKLISKKVVTKIPKLEAERGAFITSEFLIKAKRAGFEIAEVGVHHFPRQAGTPTGRHFNVIIKSFVDLFKLWIS